MGALSNARLIIPFLATTKTVLWLVEAVQRKR